MYHDKYHHNRAIRADRLARARRRGVHTVVDWADILKETGGVCVACFSAEWPVVKDHIVPLCDDASSDGKDNIQPLCSRCNASKRGNATNYLAEWRGIKWRAVS